MKITEEFCVHGYYRTYDGIALLKHALHNTCPDMMKCIGKQLQKIAKEQNTKGEYRRIGEIHGFPILICSEPLDKDGLAALDRKIQLELAKDNEPEKQVANGERVMPETTPTKEATPRKGLKP